MMQLSIYAPNKNLYRHIPFFMNDGLPPERRCYICMFKDVKAYPWAKL